MKTFYEAEDGRTFICKDECLQYEEELLEKEMKGNLIFTDEILTSLKPYESGSAEYVYVVNKEGAAIAKKINDFFHNFPIPVVEGFFLFNEDTDEWLDLDDEIEYLKHRIETLEADKKRLQEKVI